MEWENKKEKEVLKVEGVLRGVEVTQNKESKGSWKERASLKIERASDGKTIYASTFNEDDIKTANSLNGKNISVKYTKSKDGKYRNMVNGSVEAVGEIKEEKVKDTTLKQVKAKPEPEGEKVDDTPPKYADNRVQKLIVRQNSWSQAEKYVENCLKAVELGILSKDEWNKEDLNVESIQGIAHKIEEDILRT